MFNISRRTKTLPHHKLLNNKKTKNTSHKKCVSEICSNSLDHTKINDSVDKSRSSKCDIIDYVNVILDGMTARIKSKIIHDIESKRIIINGTHISTIRICNCDGLVGFSKQIINNCVDNITNACGKITIFNMDNKTIYEGIIYYLAGLKYIFSSRPVLPLGISFQGIIHMEMIIDLE